MWDFIERVEAALIIFLGLCLAVAWVVKAAFAKGAWR